MNNITEKVKNCTEDVLKKLENINCKRRHSPDSSNLKKPKLSQRSKWSSSQIENIPYIPKFIHSNSSIGLDGQICEEGSCCKQKQFTITELLKENRELKDRIFQSEELRKILHMQLIELKGRMKIFCRVKPSENKCIEYPGTGLRGESKTIAIFKNSLKTNYVFDKVFNESTSQVEIFNDVEPYIQKAIDGGKVCIFSYGQTGSGKTYTLEGSDFHGHLSVDSGVLPRASVKIYSELNRQHLNSLNVYISCIEVYLDNITDLLQECKGPNKAKLDQVWWKKVESIEELLDVIYNASLKRTTRGTHHNINSSRSHTVYQIRIEGIGLDGSEIKGKLSVIDLAGSERANTETFTDKTSEEIESMKKVHEEGKYINKSLSCLKRVFESLSSKNTNQVPPYRETKLTRLLQDQLQYGEVIVIITVSPDNFNESKESLKFGSTVQLAKI